MLVEGRLDSASPTDLRIHVGGEPLLANGTSHFRVRRQVRYSIHRANQICVNCEGSKTAEAGVTSACAHMSRV
jgi:hypothetical protein